MPTTLAIVAVAGCALGFSALDLLRKALSSRVRPLPLLAFLSLGTLPVFAVWWWLAAARGAAAGYFAPGLASVVLNIAANLAFLQAVRVSPFSLTIPFLSLTPVFTALIAYLVLGEAITRLQIAGIVLVVLGAFRLNLQRGEGATPARLWRAFLREPGSVMMTGVALLWSLAMPLDKLALEASSAPFHALLLNAGVGAGSLLLLVAARRSGELRALRETPGLAMAAVLTGAAAIGLQLLAIGMVWVSLVETVKRALGSSLAVALGWWLYAEPVTWNKAASIGLMGAGVALVLMT